MRQELITKFARQPTDDHKKFIVANLKYIFNDDYLARNFSWKNVNNNISVNDFICIKLLKDSISGGVRFSSEYAKTTENLQLSADSRTICQGFTAKQGTLHNQHALECGTKLVGCISLKKGGTTHLGFPVFASPEQKRQLIRMQLLFMWRHRELLLLS
ncbi:succinate--CoA ligase [ADP/GDP-forming] subunit alpha, mitochondrial-like isoform X2 [Eurosta solidaginis]|uniref:succinate--CoA ligase [ADP/GDP-forming] subunit alpha, mitochondrial-like isoform X2 n=1 Tax=Eurosta solidaginis TaxID=178769 RepID=UPI003530CC8D